MAYIRVMAGIGPAIPELLSPKRKVADARPRAGHDVSGRNADNLFKVIAHRACGGLALLLATLSPALAQSCGGVDLIAKMKREEPARYEKLAAEGRQLPFGDARYFRIQKGKAAPSYLFGTAHVSDPRALDWVAQIEPRVTAARVVAVENNDVDPRKPNPGALFKFAAMMVSKPDELIVDRLDAGEFNRLVAIIGPRLSMTREAVARLRPWFLYISLALPLCEIERAKLRSSVDTAIAAHGETRGRTVRSLETVEEMLGAIMAPPIESQIDFLRSAMATYSKIEDYLETTLRALDRGEVGLFFAYVRDLSLPTLRDPRNFDIFMKSLIDDRNEIMFRNARPLVDKGGAFIAVGALHLPGKKGLARMFKDAGYRVTPMKLRPTMRDG